MSRAASADIEWFAEIEKIDEDRRTVFGWASTETRDRQGEIVTKAAIEEALPGYWLWKNVREMHQPSAVGTAIEAKMMTKGLWFGAQVSDDRAWKKVKDKVYKGFSIGGRVRERDANDPTIVTKVDITEISLVDRPANPDARFELVKRSGDHLLMQPVQYWGCGCKDHQHIAKAEAQECMADHAETLIKAETTDGGLLKFTAGSAGGEGPASTGSEGDRSGAGADDLAKATPRHIEGGKFAGHLKSAEEAGVIAKRHADHAAQFGKLADKHRLLAEESRKAGNTRGAAAHETLAKAHRTVATNHEVIADRYTRLAVRHGEWSTGNTRTKDQPTNAVAIAKQAFAAKLAAFQQAA